MEPTNRELALAGIVALALPVMAELALRVAHVQFEPQLYIADQQRGWVLRAGAQGVITGEAQQLVRINDRGLRDHERQYEKPADVIRIAVLGNSWTEALQVPLEKTYCFLLERKLARCQCFIGKRVEVLNFGVSGYSTAQELLTLRYEVRKYHPDIVILAFYSARDVANNMRMFNNAANPEQSPYFVYRGASLVLDDSFRSLPVVQKRQIMLQRTRSWINDRIRVLEGLNALIRRGRVRLAAAVARERASQAGNETLEYGIYKPPAQPAVAEAWRVTEGLLCAMRDEARAQGASLRIVSLANRPQVIQDPAKRQAVMLSLGVSDLSYADERIKALGKREGIPVTILAPRLASYAEKHHVFLNGFNATNMGEGHWNETGHRLAAEAIAADLCECESVNAPADLTAAR
jgi:hypothetical protein